MSKNKRRRDDASSRVGADEALETLVNQFSDPLVFLRELVQNSLDAASTRIDVDFAFEPASDDDGAGLMTITVTDNGEGMNEGIIDRYLLTLFSSTKEGDLTKIGKFGVGFVSIFAIAPDLVVLDTGQAGESWRVLFHKDRSYEKLRLDEPVEGTTIALHRRASADEFDELRQRGAATVRYWCKYAEAEIAVDGATIAESFGVDAALAVSYEEPGTAIALGFARPASVKDLRTLSGRDAAAALAPVVGFYNRGLTLVESNRPPDSDGGEASFLAGLSVRVKSRYLEHTLTRDNVRQDENYAKALSLVRAQVGKALVPALVAHLEALARYHSADQSDDQGARAGEPAGPDIELALVYARLPCTVLAERAPDAAIIPTVTGAPVTVSALRVMKTPTDTLLSAPRANPVTALLAQRGVIVVREHLAVFEHLRGLGFSIRSVNGALYTAVAVEPAPHEARVLSWTGELLDKAKARVDRVVLGDLDYPGSDVANKLYVRQEEAFGLTRPGHDDQPGWLGGARDVVLNRKHALVAGALALADTEPALAAQILAQAVCVNESADAERSVDLARLALAWRRSRARQAAE